MCGGGTGVCAAYGYTADTARNLHKDFEEFRHLLIAEESHDICVGEGAEVSVVSEGEGGGGIGVGDAGGGFPTEVESLDPFFKPSL